MMKRSEKERGCEHSNTKQTGVCSSCLRDKLSMLCVDSSYQLPIDSYPFSGADSPDKPLVSQPTSNYVVPNNLRNLKDSSGSSRFNFIYGFKESKSITLGSTGRGIIGGNESEGWGSKKHGIWTKILKFKRKGTNEAFMHSRTTREGQGQGQT